MPNATQRHRANRTQGRRPSNGGKSGAAQPSRARVNGKGGASNAPARKSAPHISRPQSNGNGASSSRAAKPSANTPSTARQAQRQAGPPAPVSSASSASSIPTPRSAPDDAPRSVRIVPVLTPPPIQSRPAATPPAQAPVVAGTPALLPQRATVTNAAPPAAPAHPPTHAATTSAPASAAPAGTRQGRQRNPRIVAALCYAVPFLPAVAALFGVLGKRRNRFLRTHAIQSLLFFVALAGIQITLFIAVVALGTALPVGWFGLTVALGLLFYALTIGVALAAFLLWTALIRDALRGELRSWPLLTRAALLIERWAPPQRDGDAPKRPPIWGRRRLQPVPVE